MLNALALLAFQTPAVVDTARLVPYTAKADVGDYYLKPPYAKAPELTARKGRPKGGW